MCEIQKRFWRGTSERQRDEPQKSISGAMRDLGKVSREQAPRTGRDSQLMRLMMASGLSSHLFRVWSGTWVTMGDLRRPLKIYKGQSVVFDPRHEHSHMA
jgi:hypothetical protein